MPWAVSRGPTGDGSQLSKDKQTRLGLYMTAGQAYSHMMANMDKSLFIDTRTPSELNYPGAATVMDAHVPLVFMDSSGWDDKKHRYLRTDNKNFVADIEARLKRKGLTKDDTVILMCRSGKRSARAADLLAAAASPGYTALSTVTKATRSGKARPGGSAASMAGRTPACRGPVRSTRA